LGDLSLQASPQVRTNFGKAGHISKKERELHKEVAADALAKQQLEDSDSGLGDAGQLDDAGATVHALGTPTTPPSLAASPRVLATSPHVSGVSGRLLLIKGAAKKNNGGSRGFSGAIGAWADGKVQVARLEADTEAARLAVERERLALEPTRLDREHAHALELERVRAAERRDDMKQVLEAAGSIAAAVAERVADAVLRKLNQ
jgi:hypothetical protein